MRSHSETPDMIHSKKGEKKQKTELYHIYCAYVCMYLDFTYQMVLNLTMNLWTAIQKKFHLRLSHNEL